VLNALGIPQVGEQTAIDLAAWIVERWPAEGMIRRMDGPRGPIADDRSPPRSSRRCPASGRLVAGSIAGYFGGVRNGGSGADLVDAGVVAEPPPDEWLRGLAPPALSPARRWS